MKKYVLLLAAFFAVQVASAESILKQYYNVVSNAPDKNVKAGTCLLKGKAVDLDGKPIPGGVIANLDRSHSCTTDSNGNYSVTLSTKDTAVFFYHPQYGEIVIWKFEFKSQHVVVIDFFSMMLDDYPVEEEKPVIYIYADEPTTVSVQLHHPDLKFTYPHYNNGWTVQASTDGVLKDSETGKNYPYLFWEGTAEQLSFTSQNDSVSGFMISSDSVVSFLESSLTALGLNQTEQTDFITYWGPRLAAHPYAFVQFIVDEQYDTKIAKLNVTPAPVSQRRIYLLFMPLDQAHVGFSFATQQLPPFERKGLTLIEWGGSELRNPLFVN